MLSIGIICIIACVGGGIVVVAESKRLLGKLLGCVIVIGGVLGPVIIKKVNIGTIASESRLEKSTVYETISCVSGAQALHRVGAEVEDGVLLIVRSSSDEDLAVRIDQKECPPTRFTRVEIAGIVHYLPAPADSTASR